MTFNSWEFLLFYPIVALLYFVLPKRARWIMLLIASYYFYMCYQAELVFLIAGTTLVSWLASRAIERSESRAVRRFFLTLTLVVCFGVLFFYKYFNFLADSAVGVITLLGGQPTFTGLSLMLPVGISFYTFQTLSYVIDVYRGDVKTEKNFFFYALFVSFFPQLVAGPIERPDNLIPQLKEHHRFTQDNFVKGAKHMLVGFFKKVVVADTLALYVDAVYNAPTEATGLSVAIASLLFGVQIYCDFSGYTDIAIGCARIMGIRLMKNFDHPYMATSVKEFWSRWHISLSTWFKDYLYFPLGGNRRGTVRTYLNLMIVFMVSGLWHGANWTFVIWGALHGLYQCIGRFTFKKRQTILNNIGLSPDGRLVSWVRRVNTTLLVTLAWVFFRANSVTDASTLLRALFTDWAHSPTEVLSGMGLTPVAIVTVLLSFITLLIIDRLLTYDDALDGSDALVRHGAWIYYVWGILILWGWLLSQSLGGTFIYFQF